MVGPRVLRAVLLSIAGLPAVAGAALLGVMSFLGVYLRPTSDDWCALAKTRDMGVLGIARNFYGDVNGRFTNGLLNGLVNADGLTGMKVLPAVLVVSLGLGLVLLLRRVFILAGRPAPLPVLIAMVAVAEVLLFAAPHSPYQALLWAPGTISHTLPTVIVVWLVLFGVSAGRSGRSWVRPLACVTVFAAGVFLATLSEPSLIMAGLAAGAAGILFVPRFRLVSGWYPVTWCATACLGLIAGFAVLYTSPGWGRREAQVGLGTPQFTGGQLRGAFQDWLRVADAVTSQWTYVAAVAVGVLGGLMLAAEPNHSSVRPRWLITTASILPVPLVLIGSYLVILAARWGYGPSGWTYYRIWFNFLAPMVFALIGYGILAGSALARAAGRHGGRSVTAATLAGTLATAAFVLYAVAALVPRVDSMATDARNRAIAWDRQDDRIRAEVAHGATEVTYQPLYIGGLAEPFFTRTYSRDWVASCVSTYYRVQRVNRPEPAG